LALLIATPAWAEEASLWQETLEPTLTEVRPIVFNIERLLVHNAELRRRGLPTDRSVLEQALGLANRACSLRPRDPEIRHLRSRVLYGLERWTDAANDLAEAIRLDPEGPFTHEWAFDLGVALTRLQRWDEAADAYRRFLEECPWPGERSIALTNLGETLMSAGDLEGALVQFRLAVTTAPHYTHAHLGLAVALDRQGDPSGAHSAMLQAMSTGAGLSELESPAVFFVPAWEIFYYRALAAEVTGQVDLARRHWQSFLSEGGQDGPYATRAREHLEALE
jgi:tetratricopeptide (TPR) repeat protein